MNISVNFFLGASISDPMQNVDKVLKVLERAGEAELSGGLKKFLNKGIQD